jgi:two-component system phosphate regulon sensor histidine kinase PhoR
MVVRPKKTGLSRKIVAYYLVFCLSSVCWVAVALLITAHALLTDRAANGCLSRLGKAGAAIEIHWVRHKDAEGLGEIVAQLRHECPAAYWAIVGLDGRFLAHTDPSQIGKPAGEPPGERGQVGDAASVRYREPSGRMLQEYRAALTAGNNPFGELRVAVEEPTFAATIQAAASSAPIAVLAPMSLVAAGAVVLSRLVRPVASIETRLREIAQAPIDAEVRPAAVRARDAASLGWNRVVDEVERGRLGPLRADAADALSQAADQRSQAQFEQILQRLSDGVAVTDAEGRIAFANRAVAALLGEGVEADGLQGACLEDRLLRIAECPGDSDLLSPAAQKRTVVAELAQRDGEMERVLRVARLPLEGRPQQGHVWSLRDVTQQKLAEQTRDRFIDTATHELRTPLANSKAYAETLASADYIDVELQKEFCNTINSEVTRLARFIDDLLSISSMEVGALTIERQKIETERLFGEVLAKVAPLMQKKQLGFQVALPPKMPELHVDKDKIVAVLVNILGNAAKYTPEDGRVSLKVKVEDGKFRASVEDSGVGISAEDIPRLFEKFFRSEDPRVQAEVGTGLGLSLAREVVRMHGGEIAGESQLNKGSTFTVSLPLA